MGSRKKQSRNGKSSAKFNLPFPTVESETESMVSNDRLGHHDQSSARSIDDHGMPWNGGLSNRTDVFADEEAGYRSMYQAFAEAEAEHRASRPRQACPNEQQRYAVAQPSTPAPAQTPYYIAPQSQPHTVIVQQPQQVEFLRRQQVPVVQQQPLNYFQSARPPLPQRTCVSEDDVFPPRQHIRNTRDMHGDINQEWFPPHLSGGGPFGGGYGQLGGMYDPFGVIYGGHYASGPRNAGNQPQASSATMPSYPDFVRGNLTTDASMNSPELFEAFGDTFNAIKALEADLRTLGKKVNRIMQLRYRE
jgi:hypothetical protein